MTPTEQAAVRDLEARLALCERRLSYARRHQKAAETRRARAEGEARFLHGVLKAKGIYIGDAA